MARPITVTKEKILSASLELIRSGGPSSLTARNLCASLGCGANAIFSSFGSIQGVRDAVREEARVLYRRRVSAGFSLNPPFKGFGMALLWFAMDEPQLYSLVMDADMPAESFEDYADTYVGFKQESLAAITTSFNLRGHEAEMLYYQMVLVALGLAQACTQGGCHLSIPQVSEILGKNVRAFLMVIRAGADEREKYVPRAGIGPGGDVDSYAMMQSLAGLGDGCGRDAQQDGLLGYGDLQENGWNWNACSVIPSILPSNPSNQHTRDSQKVTSVHTSFLTCISPYPSRPSCWESPLPQLPKHASGLRQN